MNKFACICGGIHVESLSPKVEKKKKNRRNHEVQKHFQDAMGLKMVDESVMFIK
jgi:hypothetical protein